MSLRAKTALYRKCHLTDGAGKDASDGLNLQDALKQASLSVTKPWVRALGAGGAPHQLLTRLTTKNFCTCGEIAYYEPGRKIPLVDIEANGDTWQDTIHPTDTKGVHRKFQEQSIYFAIRENHIAMLQSVSFQSDDLEMYLQWLIQEKASLLPNALIHLQNPPARIALEKLKDHKIKGIKIGERLFTNTREVDPSKSTSKRKRYIQRIETSPRLLDILTTLGVGKPIIEKLSENPDPGSIQVDIDISYRSRNEKDSISILTALADTLGKQEGLDTEIRLDGKSSIKGSELTVKGQINVQCPDGCIASEDALSKLSDWLIQQIKTGKMS